MTLLGILAHHTPLAANETAQLATAFCSFEEAVSALAVRGRTIDIKTLRCLTYHFADAARITQATLVDKFPTTVANKRCVISVDGGRIRIRKNKRGQKTKKNRHRFKADWQEPKLLHIWLIDENGKIRRDFSPWIDGTLKGADTVFILLSYYLKALTITAADQILFIADGAPWIWNRLPALIENLMLDPAKVYQILDFYHAIEHLSSVAKLCKKWSPKRQNQWVRRMKGYLWNGKTNEVIEQIRSITRGRNSKLISREKNYFEENICRMNYAQARLNNLPIGSGPMESAIRRVINLRMKGNGIFWCEENAEAMIMLRAYYKAGRWNDLFLMATAVTGFIDL